MENIKKYLKEKFFIKLIGYIFLLISFIGFVIVFDDSYNYRSDNSIYQTKSIEDELNELHDLKAKSTVHSISIRNSNFPTMIGLFAIAGAILISFGNKKPIS